MSLINRMLRELDRRQPSGAKVQNPAASAQVRAVSRSERRHEWFWRIVAVLVLASAAWVAWVAYQLKPHAPIATELAMNAAEAAKARPTVNVSQAPAPAKPAAPPPASAVPPEPRRDVASASPPRQPPLEILKLAQLIETPIPALAAPSTKPRAARAAVAPVVLPSSMAVTRRDRPRSAEAEAEDRFREGVALLNQGRVSDAQQDFAAALQRQAAHEPARQALVSILIDRGQLEEARQRLQEGLALNPAQVQFANVLARILVERRDYAGAAGVLEARREAGRNDPDYQLLLGAVLQRLGRHVDAAEAFRSAIELKNQPGAAWVALGVSLEASGKKQDAIQAYRRSLLASALSQDTRSYAETRIRALR